MGRKKTNQGLVAVDLFAGCGGFSEGFRQVGIQVRTAYDIWKPARLTHQHNHPDTKVIDQDVLSLDAEQILAEVSHVDILFGSPPCTEFSASKNGGKGDIDKGLEGVFAFFRLVHQIKPQYWVMENVPRLDRFLKKLLEGDKPPYHIPLRTIHVDEDGHLEIPVYRTMNAQWFGVPQRRERLFVGEFPIPAEVDDENLCPRNRTLGEIIGVLPNPECPPDLKRLVSDPTYPDLNITTDRLTDHFGLQIFLDEDEVYHTRRLKRDHPYYGLMAFPDDLSLPARTILARQNRVAREAIYISSTSGIRRLTPREIACLMGFPITYQFHGDSARIRYSQIGNSVCPPVAAAIGRGILKHAGVPIPTKLLLMRKPKLSPPAQVKGQTSTSVVLKANRSFRQHPPSLKVGTRRVDIENCFDEIAKCPHPLAPEHHHATTWRSVLHVGIGEYECDVFDWRIALRDLISITYDDPKTKPLTEGFLQEVADQVVLFTPDATSLQGRWTRRIDSEEARPERWLGCISEMVEKWYPSLGIGKEQRITQEISLKDKPQRVPLAVVACLVAASFSCECANHSIEWIYKHPEDFYWPYGPRPRLDASELPLIRRHLRQEFLGEKERMERSMEELVLRYG